MSKRTKSSDTWSDDLEWYLLRRDAACGVRSGLGAQIAAIERGISTRTFPTSDPYRDDQVGLGPAQERAFARDRKMRQRWAALAEEHRAVLRAHYGAAAPSDAPGCEPPSQRAALGAILDRVERAKGKAKPRAAEDPGTVAWARAEGQLGTMTRSVLAASESRLRGWVASWMAGSTAAIPKALIDDVTARVRAAHRAYADVCQAEAQRWAEGEA